MGTLTGKKHGDAANVLFAFYGSRAADLEESGQYYMAAVALAFALETAILTYLLVEFGSDNGGELKIPDTVGFFDLIDAANEIDVLRAPIDAPSHVREAGERPKYVAADVVDKIRKFPCSSWSAELVYPRTDGMGSRTRRERGDDFDGGVDMGLILLDLCRPRSNENVRYFPALIGARTQAMFQALGLRCPRRVAVREDDGTGNDIEA